MNEPAKCRSCGAPIWWAITKTAKKLPVDAAPVPTGGLVLSKSAAGTIKVEPYTPASHPSGRNRYLPHWSTCPNAAEHRRAK